MTKLSGRIFLCLLTVNAVIACGDDAADLVAPYIPPSNDAVILGDVPAVSDAGAPDVGAADASVDVATDLGVIPDGGVCVPASTFCAEGTLYTCKEDGSDYVAKKCTNACQNNECVNEPRLCVPNKVFCDVEGQKIMKCSEDGYSAAFQLLCPDGCNEATADCKSGICNLGDTRCDPANPKKVQVCNQTESGWSPGETCSHLCEFGVCIDPVCSTGEMRCSSSGVEQCNSTQTAFEVTEECQFGCLIHNNSPMCALCLEDDLACDVDETTWDVVQCNPVTGYQTVEECFCPEDDPWCLNSEYMTCTAGYCIKQISITGPKED
ncbi:MAG: hypothetical protein VX223_06610, partial [Myxococcota bacterium]|nr:hypothetical protein [Myxococcota bacterium]